MNGADFWHPWVGELDWIEQAKIAGAIREPDSGAEHTPALLMLALWMRRVCCRLRDDSTFFYVEGDHHKTRTPTPEQVIGAMQQLAGASTYAPAVRDALRVISMHAEAPTDRATALRFLTPLIEFVDEHEWMRDETPAD